MDTFEPFAWTQVQFRSCWQFLVRIEVTVWVSDRLSGIKIDRCCGRMWYVEARRSRSRVEFFISAHGASK